MFQQAVRGGCVSALNVAILPKNIGSGLNEFRFLIFGVSP